MPVIGTERLVNRMRVVTSSVQRPEFFMKELGFCCRAKTSFIFKLIKKDLGFEIEKWRLYVGEWM